MINRLPPLPRHLETGLRQGIWIYLIKSTVKNYSGLIINCKYNTIQISQKTINYIFIYTILQNSLVIFKR